MGWFLLLSVLLVRTCLFLSLPSVSLSTPGNKACVSLPLCCENSVTLARHTELLCKPKIDDLRRFEHLTSLKPSSNVWRLVCLPAALTYACPPCLQDYPPAWLSCQSVKHISQHTPWGHPQPRPPLDLLAQSRTTATPSQYFTLC